MKDETHLPDTLEELRQLERHLEREWWWLHGALNAVAHMRVEQQRSAHSFREMQAQAREVDRRRVQIAVRIAQIDRDQAMMSTKRDRQSV